MEVRINLEELARQYGIEPVFDAWITTGATVEENAITLIIEGDRKERK
jgi:hypothetical protein